MGHMNLLLDKKQKSNKESHQKNRNKCFQYAVTVTLNHK